MGVWLERYLEATSAGLWLQTGYFGFEALAVHAEAVRTIAERGRAVHVVLGANQGSLAGDDLRQLVALFDGAPQTSITVVAYANGLFHPKVYVIQDSAGEYCAYVGSANLTGAGVGLNVEAGVTLATADGDAPAGLREIVRAIESWAVRDDEGIFHVCDPRDVEELLTAGIAVEALPRIPRLASRRTTREASSPERGIGRLVNLYPTAPLAPLTLREPLPPPELESSALCWTKTLRPSDAQQVDPGTNPTGKLRLSKAGHDIDHKTWFREILFGEMPWITEIRDGKPYEVARVPFRVSLDDADLGVHVLVVDHAPHRVADQNNVPTILAWGSVIGGRLSAKSYVGKTVTLERAANGEYQLSIG